MDRKTTTFIILLGLIMASSLFHSCIEGNSALKTLKYRKVEEENAATRLYKDLSDIKKDVAPADKEFTRNYRAQIEDSIRQSEKKINDLEKTIQAIQKQERKIQRLEKKKKEQEKKNRKLENSAQGVSIALGKLQPNIVRQREIQNDTKGKVGAAIKKINSLKDSILGKNII